MCSPVPTWNSVNMFTEFFRLIVDIYQHQILSIRSVFAQWNCQTDKSLPIALLCLLSSVVCDDFNSALNNHALLHYQRYHRPKKTETGKKEKQLKATAEDVIANWVTVQHPYCIDYRPIIKVVAKNVQTGESIVARALLDTGAAFSDITCQLAEKLGLVRQLEWPFIITGFPGVPNTFQYENVQLELLSLDESHQSGTLTFQVDQGPNFRWEPSQSQWLCQLARQQFGIELTDEASRQWDNRLDSFDILLGQDCLNSVILLESSLQNCIHLDSKLVFFETRFGWTTMGKFEFFKYAQADDASMLQDIDFGIPKSCTGNGVSEIIIPENSNVQFSQLTMRRKAISNVEKQNVFAELLHFLSCCIIIFTLLLVMVPLCILKYFVSSSIAIIATRMAKIPHRLPEKLDSTTESRSVFRHLCAAIQQSLDPYFHTVKPHIARVFLLGDEERLFSPEEIPYSICPQMNIQLASEDGHRYEGMVLLDSGSYNSYIDGDLADRLQCTRISRSGVQFVQLMISSLDREHQVEPVQIELCVHQYPIDTFNFDNSHVLSEFVHQQYGITFPAISSEFAGEPVHIILGCDVLSQVFFPSPYRNIEVAFCSLSNLWLISTRLGWTYCGNSFIRHRWRQRYSHFEVYNFRHNSLLSDDFWSRDTVRCYGKMMLFLVIACGMTFYLLTCLKFVVSTLVDGQR